MHAAHRTLVSAGALLLLGACTDPKPGPAPCVDDPVELPPLSYSTPRDGLADARSACVFQPGTTTQVTLGVDNDVVTAPSEIPIDHVVVIMLENRSFDHYLSKLEGDVDVATNETNPGAGGVPIERLHETSFEAKRDLDHEWEATHLQYDRGKLDGFVVTNDGSPDGRGTMNYYDENDLPLYYWLAKNFATSDRYFSSLLGPTWPNRYFFLAGTAAGRTTTPGEAARSVEIPEFLMPSIFTAMGDRAVLYSPNEIPLTRVMLPSLDIKTRTLDDFKSDASNGNLPGFSFVEPIFTGSKRADDHPPYDVRRAEAFVSCIVAAIGASKSWSRTVVLITWDEHGGYYDHVPPPRACEPDGLRPSSHLFDRLGFRVPLLIVSPYVRPGHVSHMIADHTSITRLVEHLFGLGALTVRDANAWPLLDAFDFSHMSVPDFPLDDLPDVGLSPAEYCP
jgi:phospholipase C